MTIELTASQEVGERVLLDTRCAPVGKKLLAADGLQQRGGTVNQPIRSAGARVLLAEPA
ncbi:MAG TPA: hypothetical protein VHT29_13555 [Solirubrobacteraceae bacterium]|nr:hypothetical protein [Solirubrobacteraceae bacterium]